MYGYDQRPLTDEEKVDIRRDNVRYRQRSLAEAEVTAARTPMRRSAAALISAVVGGSMVGAGIVGSVAGWFGWLREPGDLGSLGFGLVLFGVFGVALAAAGFADARSETLHAPLWVESAHSDLTRAEVELEDAEAAASWAAAEKKRLRELPAALGLLTSLVATNSRDWGRDRGDARLYAIICGWDGDPDDPADEGAWAELAEAHGWASETVRKLRDAREAYVYAAAAEEKRRRS